MGEISVGGISVVEISVVEISVGEISCGQYGSTCQYGDTKCWFKHSKEKYDQKEKSEGENMEHNEVVEKLFDIVEKVTERLAKLEKSNQILTNSANEG